MILNQPLGAISKNHFFAKLKKHILTSVWSVQHTNAGQNIQQIKSKTGFMLNMQNASNFGEAGSRLEIRR